MLKKTFESADGLGISMSPRQLLQLVEVNLIGTQTD